MSANRISEPLPQDLLDRTKTATLELVNLWKPEFLTLDPAEREGMARMGPAKTAVARDASEIVAGNPGFMPAYKSNAEFSADLANARALRPVVDGLKDLVRELETLLLVSESEAYDTALAIYANIQTLAQREGGATAQAAAERMGAHFANRRNKKNAGV